jgi:hypothetical protein
MYKLLFAASMLCIGATAHAEPFSNMGPGLMPCATFNQLYKAAALADKLNAKSKATKDLEDYYFAWAQGFMSAMNDAFEDTIGKYRDLRSVSTDYQKQSLRAFCEKNPASKYRDGIEPLLNVMTIVPSTHAPAYPVQR